MQSEAVGTIAVTCVVMFFNYLLDEQRCLDVFEKVMAP